MSSARIALLLIAVLGLGALALARGPVWNQDWLVDRTTGVADAPARHETPAPTHFRGNLPPLSRWEDYARGQTVFAGPVSARLVRVIDGDTFDALADTPRGRLQLRIRIRGVDTPERDARCDAEAAGAGRARAWLAGRLRGGPLILTGLSRDKYPERLDAGVADGQGDVATALIRAGLGRPYDGGWRKGWCGP